MFIIPMSGISTFWVDRTWDLEAPVGYGSSVHAGAPATDPTIAKAAAASRAHARKRANGGIAFFRILTLMKRPHRREPRIQSAMNRQECTALAASWSWIERRRGAPTRGEGAVAEEVPRLYFLPLSSHEASQAAERGVSLQ
jgi:hypothetical protein